MIRDSCTFMENLSSILFLVVFCLLSQTSRLISSLELVRAVKVTPAHSFQDYEVAKRHNLELIEIFDDRGCIVGNQHINGRPRFEVRDWVLDQLSNEGLLDGKKPHSMVLPTCSRTGDVIEPRLKLQWFIRMEALSKAALQAVETGALSMSPSDARVKWSHFLSEGRDWCISRQLWWGHRMPLYWVTTRPHSVYGDQQELDDKSSVFVVAQNNEEAYEVAAKKLGINKSDIVSIEQESDVLDTWFSSGLLPFAAFGWPAKSEDLEKYYPLSLLETGHDILFFWVARMVMLGLHLTNQLPFKKVFVHSLVCDSEGHKMSKSKGNVIDPMDIIEPQQTCSTSTQIASSPVYGSDSLRLTLLSRNFKPSTISFDVNSVRENHLLRNKMWQTVRFLIGNMDRIADGRQYMKRVHSPSDLMDKWILSELCVAIDTANRGFETYQLHNSVSAFKTFWRLSLCDIYLEAVKPRLWNSEDSAHTCLSVLFTCYEAGIVGMSPMMPFLMEELYQYLPSCDPKKDSVMQCTYPSREQVSQFKNDQLNGEMQVLLSILSVLRSLRKCLHAATKSPNGEATVYLAEDGLRNVAEKLNVEALRLSFMERLSFLPIAQMTAQCGDRTLRQTISPGIVVDFLIKENVDVNVELTRLRKKLVKLTSKLSAANKDLSREKPDIDALNKKITGLSTEIASVEKIIEVLEKM